MNCPEKYSNAISTKTTSLICIVPMVKWAQAHLYLSEPQEQVSLRQLLWFSVSSSYSEDSKWIERNLVRGILKLPARYCVHAAIPHRNSCPQVSAWLAPSHNSGTSKKVTPSECFLPTLDKVVLYTFYLIQLPVYEQSSLTVGKLHKRRTDLDLLIAVAPGPRVELAHGRHLLRRVF